MAIKAENTSSYLRMYNLVSRPFNGLWKIADHFHGQTVKVSTVGTWTVFEIGAAGKKLTHPALMEGLTLIAVALKKAGLLTKEQPGVLSFANRSAAETRDALRALVRLADTSRLQKINIGPRS